MLRMENDFPNNLNPLKDLTFVEERLVTARLPFMIIIALGFLYLYGSMKQLHPFIDVVIKHR